MNRGELWSFLHDVLSTGARIGQEMAGESYERYSSAIARQASRYVDQLHEHLKPHLASSTIQACDPHDGDHPDGGPVG